MKNEKRLIEFGEALRMVKNSKQDCPETSVKGRAIWETAHNCALSCLISCNAVDAVEVVHGRWVMTLYTTTSKRGRVISNHKFACSVCGYGNGRKQSNYCPNCGAKMDGGNEDG